MKSFSKRIVFGLMMMAIIAGVSLAASAKRTPQVKTDPQVVAKLAQILERSGYTYRKATDNVWVVNFKGNSLAEIQVFVTSVENLVIMGAVVAKKASMKVSPEMMFKLLRIVHDIDRVKIGFDDDEDLFVRAEVTTKCFDVEEFKASMEQVSAGTDKVHAAIKTYLTK
jgi:hypothetical protein